MSCLVARSCLMIVSLAMWESALGRADAGPVNSSQNALAKNEDIEKAGAALVRGQIDDAYKALQDAAKKNPMLPPPRLMLARLLFNTKEGQQQGRAMLEQAAGENPNDPRVYITNAVVAMNEGRFVDATLSSELALKLSQADRWTADQKKEVQTQARNMLAHSAERRSDWASARAHLSALLELEKNGQLRQRLATALFFLDKTDDAFLELQQAVKDDATLEPPTVRMAQLWSAKNDQKLAREWFNKAAKAEPNNLRVHLAYANWLLQQNEVTQAKIHAETAARIDPNSPDVLKLQGVIARVGKDFGAAEALFRRVLNDSPADFYASNQLALILGDQADKNQRSRALQLATVNAQANPRSAEALATLGYLFYRTGDMENAQKSLQAAISSGQMAGDTAYYLALVLNENKKYEDVVKVLEQALQLKGLFMYRAEAQQLFDKVKKDLPKDEKVKEKK
jgi:tetratricopeptide (TPR) repeat protein